MSTVTIYIPIIGFEDSAHKVSKLLNPKILLGMIFLIIYPETGLD
jgi:hypothetical protein